jgi:TolB-like protein/DNA-binding winged helix-turn-helix (wHTH) protein/Tfp pilus assembly protein PilF
MEELVPRPVALGEFTLDPAARELRRSGAPVPLARLPFRVLVYLVEHRDRVVTRDELLDRFWDGKDVYDDTLHKCIGAIRKALGDSAANPRYVETRYREGYRYVGPVCEPDVGGPPNVDVETTRAVEIVLERETGDARAYRATATTARFALPAPLHVVGLLVVVVVVGAVALLGARRRAIEAVALPPVPAAPRSIAVLPLESLTGDPRDDVLGDGLAEGLIADLSRVNNLRVISRRSAFAFKGTRADAQEVGRRLGVASILEGSLRRSGDAVRVEVRLVSTDDGRVLWASGAGGRLTGNVLDVQDALSCEVAAELRVRLCGEGERVSSRYTRNAGAYREYIEGRYYWNKRSTDDLREAVRHFEAALAADPDYALAYAGLAETYAIMEANSNVPPGTVAADGEAAARRAIMLDDQLPGAWAALGLLENCAFGWDAGERDLRRALELNPSYAPARHWYAHSLLVRGKFEQAEAELLRARECDPLSYPIADGLAELYYLWRRYDRAVAEARAAAELDPSAADPYWTMARAYLALGENDLAVDAASRTNPIGRRLVDLRVSGRANEERAYVDELARSTFGATMPYSVACLYAGLGERDRALAWLDRACAARQADVAKVMITPELDGIRSDARYADVVRRVGLMP